MGGTAIFKLTSTARMQCSIDKLRMLWWQAGAADEAPEAADDEQDQDAAQGEADMEAEGAEDAGLEPEGAKAGTGGDLDDAEAQVELVEQVRRVPDGLGLPLLLLWLPRVFVTVHLHQQERLQEHMPEQAGTQKTP